MALKFNPLQFAGFSFSGGGSGVPSGYYLEEFTLNSGNIISKSVTIANTPTTPAATLMVISGAPNMSYSEDFTISGTTVSWNGLGLDGILEAGDIISVVYY